VRLDLLGYLMSHESATASACARAVGDSASNCSYHLRVLARHGLVTRERSSDGRERPWRATLTGFEVGPEGDGAGEAGRAAAGAVMAAALQLDQRRARDYLTRRHEVSDAWRAADASSSYTLRVSPGELERLVAAIDALLRPYIAATRGEADAGHEARLAQVGLQAFPWIDP
jgi:predicted ArsR family transcriptional regulator